MQKTCPRAPDTLATEREGGDDLGSARSASSVPRPPSPTRSTTRPGCAPATRTGGRQAEHDVAGQRHLERVVRQRLRRLQLRVRRGREDSRVAGPPRRNSSARRARQGLCATPPSAIRTSRTTPPATCSAAATETRAKAYDARSRILRYRELVANGSAGSSTEVISSPGSRLSQAVQVSWK